MKKTQKLILLFVEDISLAKAKTKMCVVAACICCCLLLQVFKVVFVALSKGKKIGETAVK